MATTEVSELERVQRFLHFADEGASTSVRRFDLGIAFFNGQLPRVHDRNFLLVTSAPSAQALLRAADALQGGAGLRHRKVVFEQETVGARLVPELEAAGWDDRRLAIMAYRGGAELGGTEASEVDRIALRPALEVLIRSESWGDEDAVRQLSDADAALAQAVHQRCFARLVGGNVVSMCRLYSDGTTAQIEDVATLPSHRNRGYAGAVVRRAATEAARDHELVFLTAVDGRWVKEWYEQLGFEQIGLRYEATRTA